jgi:hypothetical protein
MGAGLLALLAVKSGFILFIKDYQFSLQINTLERESPFGGILKKQETCSFSLSLRSRDPCSLSVSLVDSVDVKFKSFTGKLNKFKSQTHDAGAASTKTKKPKKKTSSQACERMRVGSSCAVSESG